MRFVHLLLDFIKTGCLVVIAYSALAYTSLPKEVEGGVIEENKNTHECVIIRGVIVDCITPHDNFPYNKSFRF